MKSFQLFTFLIFFYSIEALDPSLKLIPTAFYDDIPVTCNFKATATTELWPSVSNEFYACDLKFNFTSAITTITNIDGNHLETKSNENIEFLLISYIIMDLLPSNFDKFFTNLIGIKMDNVGLSSISQNDLKVFPQLKYLGMTNTLLSVIIYDTFSKNPNLELIDLRMNPISFIDSNIFDSLSNLNFLYLEGILYLFDETLPLNAENDATILHELKSTISSKCVNTKSLQNFVARFIRDFALAARATENCENDCQENCITDCDEICNAGEEELRKELNSTIDSLNECQENLQNATKELTEVNDKISQLESDLDDCKNPNNDTCRFTDMSEIYLYSCVANNVILNENISTIDWSGKHLEGKNFEDVHSLIIQKQKVSIVPRNLTNIFKNLKILVIDESGLEKIQRNDFSELSELEVLELTKNNLLSIESNSFDNLIKVTDLILSRNNLNSLPARIFDKMTALKNLNISWNNLTSIRFDIISSSNKIDQFIANGNSLSTVDINLIWRLQRASIIDLSGTECNQKFDKIENTAASFIQFYTLIINNC